MVFFICEGCNETLKKNQVDKHAAKCRVCSAVTCVDCSVTFYGNDYAAHTTCISEAEKYEKSLYKGAKQKVNPQDDWMRVIEEASSSTSAPPQVAKHMARISQLTNVPRNQKKFVNFIKNCIGLHDEKIINAIWDFISTFKKAPVPAAGGGGGGGAEASSAVKVPEKSVAPTASAPAPVEVEDLPASEDGKKTKKSKRARKEADEPSASAEPVVGGGVVVEGGDSGGEKKVSKKKSKKEKSISAEEPAAGPDSVGGQAAVEGEDDGAASQKEKKKKAKKMKTADV